MQRILALTAAAAGLFVTALGTKVPSVNVPSCPRIGSVSYTTSVPDRTPFPRTQVDLCYTDDSLELTFIAYDEVNYFFNASQGTNDDIWEYEVMEAFIYKGTEDPQTYVELEVNPNNVTYQAFVYNPSKNRTAGAPFDHFFISDPATDGFKAKTILNKPAKTWRSTLTVPLGIFNVDVGKAKGTSWRMNFFRTVVSPEIYPNQILGGWGVPDQASFHITKYFGKVKFI
ncbi:hypothetical protein MKX07_005212 [Trichoderma sp. CBMAI-0711]|jgi:hypothetical protein|uniref:Predicted protein n=3 Tax=Trichoderma TaxID=5543 RepID=G0RVZ7_HYPJQ|nr:uncharacterized protein TRIREDRAFT_112018 [Trichoderma reesei QM6a]EGR44649.1 predicted protein [Trichoderma reesei QM6a]ETR97432.1 hypothetical protein M419DRAFT_134454 [Trichoderma reesei RUT C-30]KAK1246143.1 hypothetical protein MKX07_005212 [Trichoderma sp. CBMAI-0711]OTA00335.1 hypothetical protein A9Z42_0078690 [Trichoderma parareesei]